MRANTCEIGGRSRGLRQRRAGLVKLYRVVLRGLVAAALLRHHVYQGHRVAGSSRLPEGLLELVEVVAVHRAEVLETHLVPEHRRHDQTGEAVPEPLDEVIDPLARGHLLRQRLDAPGDGVVFGMGDQAFPPVGEEADVFGDRHPVVVEDDDELSGVEMYDVVERLEAQPGSHRPVSDHGDGPRVHVAVRRGFGDAEGDGKPGAGVAGGERVVRAFARLAEPGKAPFQADVLELVAPPRHQLVGVALVGRVPDNGVCGTVENPVQRQGELDDPEVGSEMAAALGYDGDDGVTRLLCYLGQLFMRKSL